MMSPQRRHRLQNLSPNCIDTDYGSPELLVDESFASPLASPLVTEWTGTSFFSNDAGPTVEERDVFPTTCGHCYNGRIDKKRIPTMGQIVPALLKFLKPPEGGDLADTVTNFVATIVEPGPEPGFKIGVCNITETILIVLRVFDGPVMEWNLANPAREVRLYDRLVAIDGHEAPAADMVQLLNSSALQQRSVGRAVSLHMRRPVRRHVRLSVPEGCTLGIAVAKVEVHYLFIDRILPGGALEAHNDANPKEMVCKGDAIVEVNGITEDAKRMLKHLKKNPICRITFLHFG